MCKILAWEKSTQNERRLFDEKTGNLIMCKILECFVRKFIIIILFIPSFFSWKNTTCLSILILTLNTALNTREENIWKILKRRKMQTRENFWGEIIFLTKRKGKNRVFVFKIQYSVSAIFPHLAVPVLPTKWIYWALSLIFCFFIRDWNLECDCFSFLLI